VPEAIASLEEAIAGGSNDARYYFHLAAAYELARRSDEALIALGQAQALGLEDQILTEGDQQLLQNLKQKLGPTGVSPESDARTQAPEANSSTTSSISLAQRAA
jgi:hypothetical protein